MGSLKHIQHDYQFSGWQLHQIKVQVRLDPTVQCTHRVVQHHKPWTLLSLTSQQEVVQTEVLLYTTTTNPSLKGCVQRAITISAHSFFFVTLLLTNDLAVQLLHMPLEVAP